MESAAPDWMQEYHASTQSTGMASDTPDWMQEYHSSLSPQSTQFPPMLSDIEKSGLTGLGQGAIGLATVPFDLGAQAGGWLANKALNAAGMPSGAIPPSATNTINEATGMDYQPQSVAGQYAQTIGNFLPATIGANPGNIMQAMKQAALSGGGAETAKQMGYGPVGQVIGGIGGGVSGNLLNGVGEGINTISKGILAQNPEDLQSIAASMKSSAGNVYDQMRETGTIFTPEAAQELKTAVNQAASDPSFIPELNPKTLAIVSKIGNVADNSALDLGSLDQYRRLLGRIGPTEDGVSAGSVKKAIDSFVKNSTSSDITNGSTQGIDLLNQGRQAYANASRFEDISDIVSNSGGDPNKLKSGLQKFMKDPENTLGWSSDQINALKDAANYNAPEKILKMMGTFGLKFMGDNGLTRSAFPALAGGEIAMHGNPVLGLGTVGIGTGAEAARTYLARGKAQKVLDLFQQMQANGAQRNAMGVEPPLALPRPPDFYVPPEPEMAETPDLFSQSNNIAPQQAQIGSQFYAPNSRALPAPGPIEVPPGGFRATYNPYNLNIGDEPIGPIAQQSYYQEPQQSTPTVQPRLLPYYQRPDFIAAPSGLISQVPNVQQGTYSFGEPQGMPILPGEANTIMQFLNRMKAQQ